MPTPLTEQFAVRNRWTGKVQFTAEIPIGLDRRREIGAALRWAVEHKMDLRGADLSGAVLRDAVLRGADLGDAVLRGADLRGADLSGADLRSIRADLYEVLVDARAEAPEFLAALRAGRVDGTSYYGECACLLGTIARVRGVDVDALGPDASRPIERFMVGVRPGDTPATSQVAALVAEWTVKFIGEAA